MSVILTIIPVDAATCNPNTTICDEEKFELHLFQSSSLKMLLVGFEMTFR